MINLKHNNKQICDLPDMQKLEMTKWALRTERKSGSVERIDNVRMQGVKELMGYI
jgi:hypothetical protein